MQGLSRCPTKGTLDTGADLPSRYGCITGTDWHLTQQHKHITRSATGFQHLEIKERARRYCHVRAIGAIGQLMDDMALWARNVAVFHSKCMR